jgi:hypothetical protein
LWLISANFAIQTDRLGRRLTRPKLFEIYLPQLLLCSAAVFYFCLHLAGLT